MREQTRPARQIAVRDQGKSFFFRALAGLTVLACVVFSLLGYVQPVVMGVVQGLGEFLPISSSGHLIIVPWLFGWRGGVVDTLTFDVALHLGTLVAVVGYFWRDWLEMLAGLPGLARWAAGPRDPRALPEPERLLVAVVIATIPGGIAGVLLEKWAESAFRAPLLIAITLAVMGVILWLADARAPQATPLSRLTWSQALLIGLAQALALIPGVSRSGATITMGRGLTLDRAAAARFSFLLSAPITAAAVIFKLKDILHIPAAEVGAFVVGTLISAAVGALAIHFLHGYLRRAGYGIFAVYRLGLAALILAVLLARG